jgi:hypothetical protein
MSYKYKITHSFNWYETDTERSIIKTYSINHIPFTFDDLIDIVQDDPEIIKKANEQLTLTPEIFYLKSFYLIDEEAHPLLFEMNLENPEHLPQDEYYANQEDLLG